MTGDDVARFLRANLQFFEQYPDLLESIRVPHPYGGRAIPIAERQTLALREKVKGLESRLAEVMRTASENEAISEKVQRLSVAIAGARDYAALTQALYLHLREDFAVPHVAMRVWGKAVPADFQEANAVTEGQREYASAMRSPQCGAAAGSPFAPWFGEAAQHLRSIALVPLAHAEEVFGLLVLASEDAQRFYPEMGTLFLRRIGELCAAGVTARL